MQPEQPYQPSPRPESVNSTPNKKSILVPILLIIGPGLLLIVAIIGYAILNYFTYMNVATPDPNSDALFGEPASNPLRTIANIVLFLIGAASISLGPISFIVGIVLLIKNLSARKNA